MTCLDCSAPAAPGRSRCERHVELARRSARRMRGWTEEEIAQDWRPDPREKIDTEPDIAPGDACARCGLRGMHICVQLVEIAQMRPAT